MRPLEQFPVSCRNLWLCRLFANVSFLTTTKWRNHYLQPTRRVSHINTKSKYGAPRRYIIPQGGMFLIKYYEHSFGASFYTTSQIPSKRITKLKSFDTLYQLSFISNSYYLDCVNGSSYSFHKFMITYTPNQPLDLGLSLALHPQVISRVLPLPWREKRVE